VEQKLLGETVGYQDQIAAAHGGLNRIEFAEDGDYDISPIRLPASRRGDARRLHDAVLHRLYPLCRRDRKAQGGEVR
jgi:galactokinase/mevalonate kinase-like predicted kinase